MSLSPDLHQRFTEQAGWTQDARNLFFKYSGILPGSKILEVGCGTGAVLSSIQSLLDVQSFGIDFNLEMIRFASTVVPKSYLSAANAGCIPFPANCFDAVVCHFLLLWVKNPETVLEEFYRITRPGGVIGILAEPDYGNRIDYPDELGVAGHLQRKSLIDQGANPDIGRQIKELLGNSGCNHISTGILGSFESESDHSEAISEQSLLRSDLSKLLNPEELDTIITLDSAARKNHSRVQFIPTFYGWGKKPKIQNQKGH